MNVPNPGAGQIEFYDRTPDQPGIDDAILQKPLKEIIDLTRIGIWATEHCIPYVKFNAENECYVMCDCQMKAHRILLSLPKEHT